MLHQVLEVLPGARGVLVTAGSSGSSYAFHSGGGGGGGGAPLTGVVPVLSVEVQDTTGAGDGFLGGFLHYLLKAGILGWVPWIPCVRSDPCGKGVAQQQYGPMATYRQRHRYF